MPRRPCHVIRPGAAVRRDDRDQLTRLVNAHAQAVVPGMSVSVNAVLGSLGRQPGEFIEDAWVRDRVTLVAEQRDRVTAAAHLLRYFPPPGSVIQANPRSMVSPRRRSSAHRSGSIPVSALTSAGFP